MNGANAGEVSADEAGQARSPELTRSVTFGAAAFESVKVAANFKEENQLEKRSSHGPRVRERTDVDSLDLPLS